MNIAVNTIASALIATISAGMQLRANGGASGGIMNFTVADGAATTDLLISGVISQSGSNNQAITKAGAGTMTLSGANTYSGGTTIKAGTVVAGVSDDTSTTVSAFGGSSRTVNLGRHHRQRRCQPPHWRCLHRWQHDHGSDRKHRQYTDPRWQRGGRL